MDGSLLKQVEGLRAAPLGRIREKYRELFGEEPRSKHRQSLVRHIAWRLQANAEGGLSERARQRAFQIANDADVRVLPPRRVVESPFELVLGRSRFDRRIPHVGTVLNREYRGSAISVQILANGFNYQGRRYRSLSAIASEVTGTRWNGLAFFGLTAERQKGGAGDATRNH
jgi:hypothetical protein